MFRNVNIIELLEKEKSSYQKESGEIVEKALEILNEEYFEDLIISEKYKGNIASDLPDQNLIEKLDEKSIYSTEIIENICTKYRLRFLDAELFSGDIPYEATIKLKKVEKSTGIKFGEFKILAPESRFRLKDSTEDPVLFARIDTHRFLLIHKWGDDMPWINLLLYYPLRDIYSLGITSIILGLFLTMMVPESVFANFIQENLFVALVVKFNLAFVISGGVFVSFIIFGILKAREFSKDIWNSEYFN